MNSFLTVERWQDMSLPQIFTCIKEFFIGKVIASKLGISFIAWKGLIKEKNILMFLNVI
jgi:hypothetical protein